MDTLRSDRNSALTLTYSVCTMFPVHQTNGGQGAKSAEVGRIRNGWRWRNEQEKTDTEMEPRRGTGSMTNWRREE